MDALFFKYDQILKEEQRLSGKNWIVPNADDMYGISIHMNEIAHSGLIIRSFNNNYGLTKETVAYESDSAHTNLFTAIMDRALTFIYGNEFDKTEDGYTYREVIEAARRHDLPENILGDIPDNGEKIDVDEEAKRDNERIYFEFLSRNSPKYEIGFEKRVNKLLSEMQLRSSPTGRLLYVADKASAIITALCYDYYSMSPRMKPNYGKATSRDIAEMEMCERKYQKSCLASEMWTIDYFKMRSIVSYDDTGFITALIVMQTLHVNKKWYFWRKKDYFLTT